MAKTIDVLIPTAEPKIKKILVNPRVYDLNGMVVGFLWNEKPNGDFLLHRLREHLLQRYKLVRTDWGQVDGVHVMAEDASEVKQLAASADTVVIAVGD
jgi:hypothetical protein